MNLLLFIIFLHRALGAERVWQWSNSLATPSHWSQGRIPCTGQDVELPSEIMFMSETAEYGKISIEEGGELIFPSTASLTLLNKPPPTMHGKVKEECSMRLGSAVYISRPPGSWMDPSNWNSKYPTPIPHTQQVPCKHDTAVFPPNMTYKVSLHEQDVRIGGLIISNIQMSGVDWRATKDSRVGRKMFNFTKTLTVSGTYCNDPTGCMCGNEDLEYKICEYARGKCENANCSSPLKPAGHCCWNVCGAVVNIERKKKNKIYMNHLQNMARMHVGDHSQHHVSRVNENLYQIILVPNPEGNLTKTVLAARKLGDYLLVELGRRGEYSIWVEESGVGPMSKLQRSGIIFGCLILIGFITFFIYQVYNKAAHKAVLETLQKIPRTVRQLPYRREETGSLGLGRSIQAPFRGFAKFDNQDRTGCIEIQGLEDPNQSFVELDANSLIVKSAELKQEENGKSIENPMFNKEPVSNIYSQEPGTESVYEDIDHQRRETNSTTNQFNNPLFGTEPLTEVGISIPVFETCKVQSTENENGFSNPVYNTEPLASIPVENSKDLTFGHSNPLYGFEERKEEAVVPPEPTLVEIGVVQDTTEAITHTGTTRQDDFKETQPNLVEDTEHTLEKSNTEKDTKITLFDMTDDPNMESLANLQTQNNVKDLSKSEQEHIKQEENKVNYQESEKIQGKPANVGKPFKPKQGIEQQKTFSPLETKKELVSDKTNISESDETISLGNAICELPQRENPGPRLADRKEPGPHPANIKEPEPLLPPLEGPGPIIANPEKPGPLLANPEKPEPLLANPEKPGPLLANPAKPRPLLAILKEPGTLLATLEETGSPITDQENPEAPQAGLEKPDHILCNLEEPGTISANIEEPETIPAEKTVIMLANHEEQGPLLANPKQTGTIMANLEEPGTILATLEEPGPLLGNLEKLGTILANIEESGPLLGNIEQPGTILASIEDPDSLLSNIEDTETLHSNIEDPEPLHSDIEDPKPPLFNIEDPEPLLSNIEKPSHLLADLEEPGSTLTEIEKEGSHLTYLAEPAPYVSNLEVPTPHLVYPEPVLASQEIPVPPPANLDEPVDLVPKTFLTYKEEPEPLLANMENPGLLLADQEKLEPLEANLDESRQLPADPVEERPSSKHNK